MIKCVVSIVESVAAASKSRTKLRCTAWVEGGRAACRLYNIAISQGRLLANDVVTIGLLRQSKRASRQFVKAVVPKR